jgi:Sulfotransferase family
VTHKNIEGYIDVLNDTSVGGWAFCPGLPDTKVNIEINLEGETLLTGISEAYREDLQIAGKGDGNCSFLFNFEERLTPPQMKNLTVYASVDGNEKVLLEQPKEATISSDHKTSKTSNSPVFIIGAARSGTSAIFQSLMTTGAFSGYEEGFFLQILDPILDGVKDYYFNDNFEDAFSSERNTLIANIPPSVVQEGFISVVKTIVSTNMKGSRWVDKTPTYKAILFAKRAAEIWPDSIFIYMHRNGIENLCSRLNKFPDVSFSDLCKDWQRCVLSWKAIKDSLPVDRYLELDQADLTPKSRHVAIKIARLAGLSRNEEDQIAEYLAKHRPESSLRRQIGDSDEFGFPFDWDEEMRQTFLQNCEKGMVELGYWKTRP